MSTPDQLADEADAALDAGGEEAPLVALRALTEAVREQTKALTALTQRLAATPAAGAPGPIGPAQAPAEAATPGASREGWRHVGATRSHRG